jgi:hypothetical protein
VAAAVASTSRQVGGSLGVAVIGAAVAPGIGSFAESSHVGWWIVFGCGVAVPAFGLLTIGRWARPPRTIRPIGWPRRNPRRPSAVDQ